MASARSIPAADLLDQLRKLGVTVVMCVPDSHQKSLLVAIESSADMRLVTCATEDEAIAAAAGLWIGGVDCAVSIQHSGLYACVNNLRGVGLDVRVPIFILVGLLGRDLQLPPREHRGSMVRLAEPLLDALGITHHLIEGPEDLALLARAFAESREREAPVVALIGAPTG